MDKRDSDPSRGLAEDRKTVLVLFGTRPEIIKLAPVIHQLEAWPSVFRIVVVNSGQHTDLLAPFLPVLEVRVDHAMEIMRPGQTPSEICSRVLASFDAILARERPDLVLVQGDTTTALAGALGAFHRKVPVGHVEAGLRSHDVFSPFPEEMNRRLISRLARYHFAPTEGNRTNLLAEGVAAENIFVTGNPVVDTLTAIPNKRPLSSWLSQLLQETSGQKRLVLTTHRRESFANVLAASLQVIREFVECHEDLSLFFPVHPNPAVRAAAQQHLAGHPRIHLLEPLDYVDFLGLLSQAWLILSDSGGVQEEAPTLGKALLILRDNTERPEVLEAGVARLVGSGPGHLNFLLEESYRNDRWIQEVRPMSNPFGLGDSGQRIVQAIFGILQVG